MKNSLKINGFYIQQKNLISDEPQNRKKWFVSKNRKYIAQFSDLDKAKTFCENN